jgi:GH15 family glucan-1,4-alpha-glucosidase
MVDGLALRYSTAADVDALPPGEGAFLPCSFWLADSLVLIGRRKEGEAMFERLISLGNDLGLFSEEYDSRGGHMLGNFPQALTHMALIHTAHLLSVPAEQVKRAGERGERPAVVTQKS